MHSRFRVVARPCIAVAVALPLLFVALLLPRVAVADVRLMPDVTEEMSDPAFWYNKVGNPHAVLATREQIDAINSSILADSATNMNNLAAWNEGTFDGQAYATILRNGAESDAQYFYNSYGGRYYWDEEQSKGIYMGSWEEARTQLYGAMIDNAFDGDATTEMPIRFGICTTRTNVLCFPSAVRVLDAENDPDFDLQYQTALRVGEPLVIQGESNDRKFFHVFTSCTAGWVPAEDVAVCESKAEWLGAWQFDLQQTLVVCDSKIFTEESANAPQASQKMLTMGTCLKLATPEEYGNGAVESSINRAGYNCHVVWLPVRNGNGGYSKMLALVSEHCKVSKGFLPLTYANIAKVALNQLGDEYGWGGGLSSNDCSGYVRDVYKCFGLELARNTTWQEAQPVRKYSFQGMDSAQRDELLRSLPLGSVLFFGGHEMLYLGAEGENLYVISSVSRASLDGASVDLLRGTIINTLGVRRGSGYGYATWLDQLTSANVPFLNAGEDPVIDEVACMCKSGDGAQWVRGSQSGLTFVFTRNVDDDSTFSHFTGLQVDGVELARDVDYVAREGSVIVELAPAYLESLSAGTHSLVASFDDVRDVAVSFATKTQDTPETTTHAVTVESSEGGFAGVNTAAAPEGTLVTVTVRPDNGYSLKDAKAHATTGDAVSLSKVDEKTFSFVMPANDVVVSASFEVTSTPEPTPDETKTTDDHANGNTTGQATSNTASSNASMNTQALSAKDSSAESRKSLASTGEPSWVGICGALALCGIALVAWGAKKMAH